MKYFKRQAKDTLSRLTVNNKDNTANTTLGDMCMYIDYLDHIMDASLYQTFIALDKQVDDLNYQTTDDVASPRIIFYLLFLIAQSMMFVLIWLPSQSKISHEVNCI